MTSNYFVAENGVTRRSRRFSAFIGCLCDDRLGNNGGPVKIYAQIYLQAPAE